MEITACAALLLPHKSKKNPKSSTAGTATICHQLPLVEINVNHNKLNESADRISMWIKNRIQIYAVNCD